MGKTVQTPPLLMLKTSNVQRLQRAARVFSSLVHVGKLPYIMKEPLTYDSFQLPSGKLTARY